MTMSICSRRTILAAVAVVVWSVVTGCGSVPRNDKPLSAPSAVPTTAEEPLLFLVPPDTGALFKGIALLAASSGFEGGLQIVQGDSAQAGVQAVLDGKVDLALVMQQPLTEDSLVFHEIFRTPVVIFVNPDPGIATLTQEQAVAILSGDIKDWSQIGGPQMEIAVFVQEADDTTTIALRERLMGTAPFGDAAQVLANDRDMITVVNGMPGSIGYSAWVIKNLYDKVTSGEVALPVTLNGVDPGDPNYPLVASVGITFLPERQDELQPIVDWAVDFLNSESGQRLLEEYDAIPIPPNRIASEGSGDEQAN